MTYGPVSGSPVAEPLLHQPTGREFSVRKERPPADRPQDLTGDVTVVTLPSNVQPTFFYYGETNSPSSPTGKARMNRIGRGHYFGPETLVTTDGRIIHSEGSSWTQDGYLSITKKDVLGPNGEKLFEYHISSRKPQNGNAGALEPEKVSVRINNVDYSIPTPPVVPAPKVPVPKSDSPVPPPIKQPDVPPFAPAPKVVTPKVVTPKVVTPTVVTPKVEISDTKLVAWVTDLHAKVKGTETGPVTKHQLNYNADHYAAFHAMQVTVEGDKMVIVTHSAAPGGLAAAEDKFVFEKVDDKWKVSGSQIDLSTGKEKQFDQAFLGGCVTSPAAPRTYPLDVRFTMLHNPAMPLAAGPLRIPEVFTPKLQNGVVIVEPVITQLLTRLNAVDGGKPAVRYAIDFDTKDKSVYHVMRVAKEADGRITLTTNRGNGKEHFEDKFVFDNVGGDKWKVSGYSLDPSTKLAVELEPEQLAKSLARLLGGLPFKARIEGVLSRADLADKAPELPIPPVKKIEPPAPGEKKRD